MMAETQRRRVFDPRRLARPRQRRSICRRSTSPRIPLARQREAQRGRQPARAVAHAHRVARECRTVPLAARQDPHLEPPGIEREFRRRGAAARVDEAQPARLPPSGSGAGSTPSSAATRFEAMSRAQRDATAAHAVGRGAEHRDRHQEIFMEPREREGTGRHQKWSDRGVLILEGRRCQVVHSSLHSVAVWTNTYGSRVTGVGAVSLGVKSAQSAASSLCFNLHSQRVARVDRRGSPLMRMTAIVVSRF